MTWEGKAGAREACRLPEAAPGLGSYQRGTKSGWFTVLLEVSSQAHRVTASDIQHVVGRGRPGFCIKGSPLGSP